MSPVMAGAGVEEAAIIADVVAEPVVVATIAAGTVAAGAVVIDAVGKEFLASETK